MAQAPILYRETRLTPSPASPSHILDIDTSASTSVRQTLTRAGSKRPFDDISSTNDEASYARKHLATEASVFFRSPSRSPRNILWRVLDERKVLEIQAVDLVKDKAHNEDSEDSWLTFRLAIGDGILENGVQFADALESDALECLVLTGGKELVTVTLKGDLLTRASVPGEFDARTCVKRFASSFLSVRSVYRFHAVSSLELLVSLADGGLVHLRRKAGESGAQWRETFYGEGGWKGTLTLKGYNPFAGRPTVRYGSLELDPTAVADMAVSPDGKFVWTVSLDHFLRAWSTATGKVVMKRDLSGESGQKDSRQPYTLPAEQGRLLQIVTLPSQPNTLDAAAVSRSDAHDQYFVVVHSPKNHEFKFYSVKYVRTGDNDGVRLEDMATGSKLVPPVDELLNTNIWHLDTFHVQPGHEWSDTQLWIRARSGALCNTFMLTFDLSMDDQHADVMDTWSRGWSKVDAGSSTVEQLKECADYPGDLEVSAENTVTPSERWLRFLFYPDRFSAASTETALYIYRKGRGLSGTVTSRGLKAADQPLEQRLASAIGSKVMLRRSPNDQPDYQRYHQDIHAQWEAFWSVLAHLHGRRHEPVGFAFDADTKLPWSVCADFVAPVRACSALERRSANAHLLSGNASEMIDDQMMLDTHAEDVALSQLLMAARELRSTLSFAANEKLQVAARRGASQSQRQDTADNRALALFEESSMENEITDDAFDALGETLVAFGGIVGLNDEIFASLLKWFDDHTTLAKLDDRLVLGRYGVLLTVEVAREMLMQAESILFDTLALIAFMVGDLEEGDLDDEFHADVVYEAAATRLKRTQLLLWLAGHQREKTTKIDVARKAIEKEVDITGTVTLLEDIFIGDWEAGMPEQDASMLELLTLWSSTWICGPSLDDASWDVKAKEVDLAVEFLPFVGRRSSWSLYVQARLRVMTGEYAQASLDFQEAADGMAAGRMKDTANLILPHEQDAFGGGKSAYFQHVAALFEKLKVYSYDADFAQLALENTEELTNFSRSMARLDKQKSQQESPALDRIDAAQEETRLLRLKESRDEILNRLFTALLLTGRFDEACAALMQIEDSPMKRSGLKKLIDACVKQDCVPTLLTLPFDKAIIQDVDKALLDMAKKDLALTAAANNTTATPYYQILYAFRTQRSDFRGASEILHEHLEWLRHAPAHRGATQDPEDETVLRCYVLLINTLACCGEDDAWFLAEPVAGVHREGAKRRLVTLADVRREYTGELDRRSEMLQGRFPVVGGGDEMDVL
ncbi:hypothetical protein LTR91_024220 [Friedmanniomyces endolithicus]|uniref:Uncharacterized protein n=1 Tax=Friedmanniomyces endolithicus TaxID=329885 RepID=A0AAN6H260_9PEZI|nr:hypothetical protein LTR75_008770 [Friedmanniomyces endolithicus]KAK0843047.1 hypothetical protein LTS02_016236 [Friedmanniomyces endolithicus]KAK0876410.1 hypothetical protein LTR87_009711 [Friedmanniomyces endolithicus]KAK0895678.1 hypothetical protein LTR57_022899 [Friedmanniomyces endolithicus]KAK0952760.1 hypothetical protein LTR91_024220 [Friedmanniomyces endolithicus]